jgi:hypothetical protein
MTIDGNLLIRQSVDGSFPDANVWKYPITICISHYKHEGFISRNDPGNQPSKLRVHGCRMRMIPCFGASSRLPRPGVQLVASTRIDVVIDLMY